MRTMLQAYKIYMPDGYASIVRGLKSSLSTPGGPELKKLLTLQRIISWLGKEIGLPWIS